MTISLFQKINSQTGYPLIEKLIDSEDFDDINAAFEVGYHELYAISSQKKGFRTKRDVKRAMRSLELCMELFSELLAIKYELQKEFDDAQAKDKK